MEKRTENSQNYLDIECNKNATCVQSVYEEPIPVYQPTPISELEKYAPNSLSDYGFSKGFIPQDQPSYSPVVKIKTIPSPSPFSYQPSPSVTESSASSYAKEVININVDSDEDTPSPTVAQDNPGDLRTVSVAKGVQNSRNDKLKTHGSPIHSVKSKRKVKVFKNKEITIPNELNVTKTSDEKSVDSTDKDNEDDSNCTLSKRQKILSLYQDLYGDIDNDSSIDKNSLPKNASKSATLIPPYMSPVFKKPETASIDKKSDNVIASGNVQHEYVTRPRIPLRKSDKIPMPIRTRYLDQFIEECLLIYDHPSDAYKRVGLTCLKNCVRLFVSNRFTFSLGFF
ncbi:unnamed protein product [Schistosoma mattheei]|uniref:RNA exonuclease 1 homolog-like domain-containing protein n=1 Tax=Schistosoma mattheei TaxID=31246 RepID=A0A3P8G2R0_9TREM|nr:unnamed protein product [Schistosoma mattheei]